VAKMASSQAKVKGNQIGKAKGKGNSQVKERRDQESPMARDWVKMRGKV